PLRELVLGPRKKEHRPLDLVEMFIPKHFWLTGSMQRITEEEQSLNIYPGGNDLGGNTAPHRLSPYEYALGPVSTSLDLFDNLSIAGFKDLSLVRNLSSSFHVRKVELHGKVSPLGQASVEVRDERRVHWTTRTMRDDQASLTFWRVRECSIDDSKMTAPGRSNFRLLRLELVFCFSQGRDGLARTRGLDSLQRWLDIVVARILLEWSCG